MRRRSFITLAGGALAASVSRSTQANPSANKDELVLPEDSQVRTGGSRMIDVGGGYQVWTKKVGNAPIKVLLLHGGPGADHSYFECFEDFLPLGKIPLPAQTRTLRREKSQTDQNHIAIHDPTRKARAARTLVRGAAQSTDVD